jgi:MATE family multidrug resistance protein
MTSERRIPGDPRDPRRWWGVGEVVRLAVPGVINATSMTLMQFVDGWMVSKVGPDRLAAQMVGGMTAFVSVTFFMGVLACVNTFASQSLGAGRPERSAAYGWQGVWLAWMAGAALAGLIPLAPAVFGWYGHAPDVMAQEITYFQIVVAGAMLSLTGRAMGSFFLGVHRPVVPLVAGLAGNLVNVAMNYLLIFGKFGFPRLELKGAAIGTVIGFAVEAAIGLGIFLVGPMARQFKTRAACRFDWEAFRGLLRIGSPAGATFLTDILMWTLFVALVVGRLEHGAVQLAATAILWRYWHLAFMPAIGVGAATTALVGRYCGAGRTDLAWRRAHVALVLVESYMVTAGILLWTFRHPLVGYFNSSGDPAVQAAATQLFTVILVVQAFDALSVTFMGALRGAGDTFWPGVVQVALAWGAGLGGAKLIAVLFPEWGAFGAWSAAAAYIIILGLAMWVRFLRGRWRRAFLLAPAMPLPEESPGIPPV